MGFKRITIIERSQNWGLAKSIIDGVTEILNKYEKIIVLEDDLISRPQFLKFMNSGLNLYASEFKIAGISGSSHLIPIKKDFYFFRFKRRRNFKKH